MNRIDRLTAILLKLRSKRILTGQEIADHFEISLRTVYRDIRSLENAGVPIGAEAGKGYFIMDGYHLPPVMFTKEEAGSVLMADKLMQKYADKSVNRHFDNALLKVRNILHENEKEYIETLEDRVSVLVPTIPLEDTFPNHFLSDIKNALVGKYTLVFDYYAHSTDAFTTREVEPLGLVFYSNQWHLIAYCHLRKGIRDFRTDRIMKLTKGAITFDPDRHGRYIDHVSQIFNEADLKEVKIVIHKKIAQYLQSQKYYYGFVQQVEQNEETVEMTFSTGELKYFARWILMFGNQVQVVSPESLTMEMRRLSKEIFGHYHTNSASEHPSV
jgi:predicted DNA-binding transcriptional regulator YafY